MMNNSTTRKSNNSLFSNASRAWEIVSSVVLLFVGAFYLFAGINKVVRVLTRVENPNDFSWFIAICVLLFVLSFFITISGRRAVASGQKKRGILILIGLLFFILIPIFSLYVVSTPSNLSYGSDAYWYRETFYGYFQFAFSGLFFASVPFRFNDRFEQKTPTV